MWEVVGLLPDRTDTINLPPCRGNWCWWMDVDLSLSDTRAQTSPEPAHLTHTGSMATCRGTINTSLSSLSRHARFQSVCFGCKWRPGSTLESYNILREARLLHITLERSCWWPHKSHVNELWERPISHHARCMLPLLFMAIIGPCFLRQWLCTDGSDDNFAQPNNQRAVRAEGREDERREKVCTWAKKR